MKPILVPSAILCGGTFFLHTALALNRFPLLLLAIVLLAASSDVGSAQNFGADTHTVTVQIAPITEIQLTSGGVSLDITSAQAVMGQDMMTITDQSCQLMWGTNSNARKITVVTNLAAPRFILRLEAVNPTFGTAAAQVTLGTTASDLLLGIGRSTGSCALRYTGIAYLSQGTGTDVHVVTFTVQSQ